MRPTYDAGTTWGGTYTQQQEQVLAPSSLMHNFNDPNGKLLTTARSVSQCHAEW